MADASHVKLENNWGHEGLPLCACASLTGVREALQGDNTHSSSTTWWWWCPW